MKRLFVAIPLPEIIKQQLLVLSGGIPGARWQSPEQLHLTLRFIGEVDEVLAADLHSALAEIKGAPFTLALSGTGTFGPKGRERLLWAGVVKSEPLIQLRDKIEGALVRTGLPPDARKFHPHVTLARLSKAPKGRLFDFVAANADFQSPSFEVSGFALYASFLSHSGAIYTQEVEYPLDDLNAVVTEDAIDRTQVTSAK